MNEELKGLMDAINDGDEDFAAQITEKALSVGISAVEILGIISDTGDSLGEQFEKGEIFLPELFAGAEAMKASVNLVLPELEKKAIKPKGVVLIGTVEGDVHEIGKNIVCAMLAGAGFLVIDLGTDVSGEQFVEKAKEIQPDIVAASAYITTTSQRLPDITNALKEAGIRKDVKYLIGGASVNKEMMEWAGADGYAENAAQAITIARSLIEELKGRPQ